VPAKAKGHAACCAANGRFAAPLMAGRKSGSKPNRSRALDTAPCAQGRILGLPRPLLGT